MEGRNQQSNVCIKHSVTGYSPYHLLFGRKPRLPIDFILKYQMETEAENRGYTDYAQIWENQMNEAYDTATRKHIELERLEQNTDLKVTLKPLEIRIGKEFSSIRRYRKV